MFVIILTHFHFRILIFVHFMKNCILPIALFSTAFSLSACQDASQVAQKTAEHINNSAQTSYDPIQQGTDVLKSGNMLSMITDIVDVKETTNTYIKDILATKTRPEDAANYQNTAELLKDIQHLDNQLNGLNTALNSLHLQSQEVNEIRQNIIATTKKALTSPLLKGELDIHQIDFSSLEKQIGNIEGEVLKLATLLLDSDKSAS